MDTIIKKQFISSAEEQIDEKLSEIQTIRNRFTNSFEGYQSVASQKGLMIALIVVALILAVTAPFLAPQLTVFSGISETETVNLLLLITFYSTVLFFFIYAVRTNLRISQRTNLQKHVDSLDEMTAYLKRNKEQLGSIYDNIVSCSNMESGTIPVERDLSGEMATLETISHEYHDENRTAVDAFMEIMYWISSILISASFVVVTGNGFCYLLEEVTDFSAHATLFGIFGFVTAVLFVLWNTYNGGFSGKRKDLKAYFISDASGLVAMPVIGLVTAIIIIAIYALAIAAVIGIIAFIVSVVGQ